MEKLPVIFRKAIKSHGGEVCAVFPTVPWDGAGSMLSVYAHVGQHGGASWGWWSSRQHVRAKPEEYAALLKELQAKYLPEYELVVYNRMTSGHRQAFNAEVKRWKERDRLFKASRSD